MSQLVREGCSKVVEQRSTVTAEPAPPKSPSRGNLLPLHFPKKRLEPTSGEVDQVKAPETGDLPQIPVRGADHSEALYHEILEFLTQLPALVREGRPLPWPAYQTLVSQALTQLEQEGSALFWMAHAPHPPGVDYLVAHLANVGILSLKIGLGLEYDRPRLLELGLAAFLFDVGMWRLPENVLRKIETLSADEIQAIHNHPRLGAELVRQWAPNASPVMEAILQHHERENEQGYPQGLSGGAIHPHAKIIGLVDAYASLIQARPYRPRYQLHEAVREIVRTKHDSFSPQLIKALLAEVSFFPPQTLVRLNTGEVGRVVSVNRHQPLRPKVEILVDSRGNALDPPRPLDLSEAPFIYITGPMQDKDLDPSKGREPR
jgi:hypothetical protein